MLKTKPKFNRKGVGIRFTMNGSGNICCPWECRATNGEGFARMDSFVNRRNKKLEEFCCFDPFAGLYSINVDNSHAD